MRSEPDNRYRAGPQFPFTTEDKHATEDKPVATNMASGTIKQDWAIGDAQKSLLETAYIYSEKFRRCVQSLVIEEDGVEASAQRMRDESLRERIFERASEILASVAQGHGHAVPAEEDWRAAFFPPSVSRSPQR